ENEYDISNEIKNLADDEHIDNFDQVIKYLLPTDISDKTEFLDFNVGFFDIYDDRFSVYRLEDSMIEESDIEKKIINNHNNEKETINNEEISLDCAILSLNNLKMFMFNDDGIDQNIYELIKTVEKRINNEKKKSRYRNILDYLKKRLKG
ncbi:hypothetical protein DMUE_5545, partial [Dictyocoela muelleri]